jgi:hypothetical protein
VLRRLLLALPCALVMMSACSDDQLPTTVDTPPGPRFAISDGARGGTPEFFWLTPTVASAPTPTGQVDPTALSELTVEICLLASGGGCQGAPLQQLDAASLPMPSRLVFDQASGAYQLTWLSGPSRVAAGRNYRVAVKRTGVVLGFVDVAMVQSTPQLAGVNTELFTGLVKGQQFPVRFRLERPSAARYVKVNEVESNGGTPGDWVELYNTADRAIDIGGYVFRDNDDSRQYVLPAGASIPGKGYYVIDEAVGVPGFDFGLGTTDNARFYAPDGTTLIDNFAWSGGHAPTTYGRCPDGTGAFLITAVSTKGSANNCAPATATVKINEVESNGGTPGDWVELINIGPNPADVSGFVFRDNNNSASYVIPANTVIAPGGYLVLEEAQFSFGLGGADAARLFAPDGTTLVDGYTWTAHAAVTYARCPNGIGDFLATTTATKGAINSCPNPAAAMVVNEVESNGGTPGDWIEFLNTGATPVNLSGYFVKDNDNTRTYQLPAGTIVPPGAYLVVDEAQFGFGLGGGDEARLIDPDGSTVIASYAWTAHAATTYGRCPDGTGPFLTTTASTKGSANSCPVAAATVKINEVESSGGTPGDWVELVNTGSNPADVSGFVFKDDDDTHSYTLPAGSIIAPGGYLVLEEAQLGFGLGSADAARLYGIGGTTLVDSYSWSTHAAVTYGRCPNGIGEFIPNTVATKGALNSCPNLAAGIVVNEVESNGGTPGDWIEFLNTGASAVDLSGYYVKDNDNTRTYQLPAGTIVPPGAYLVVEEAQFIFGLGAADEARLIAPDNATVVASYAWTAHAATTYGRCPNGTGAFTTTTSSTKGSTNDCSSPVRINEVESDGGTPGDWVELINNGANPVDVSGYVLRDNNESPFYTIPAGTSIAAGGYLVVEAAQLGFGLGSGDAARLFDPNGQLVDSYVWTAHAPATTYGRCPNGTGSFAVTTASTKGAVNSCPGDLVVAPWPGDATVAVADAGGFFGTNMSGLSHIGSGSATPGVLWASKNGPGTVYRLLWSGSIWAPDAANSWSAGKLLRYTDGLGDVDAEGIVAVGSSLYIASERNNAASSVSRNSILRYDQGAAGTSLTAMNEWNLTADLPVVGANLGLEAVAFIPDSYLTANGFRDETTGLPYAPASYPNHGGGLFFVALEANGTIYAYALNHVTSGFTRVATIVSGYTGVMDLTFDDELQQLWAICDDTCGGRSAILRVDTAHGSPTLGRFVVAQRYERPTGMPNINNEGFAVGRQAECVSGRKPAYWADDNQTGTFALRRGTVPCTSP